MEQSAEICFDAFMHENKPDNSFASCRVYVIVRIDLEQSSKVFNFTDL